MVHFKFDSENVFCLKMSHLAKSYKKKVVFTNLRNFKFFFRQIKISCCLQNISKFHIGQINHAWLRAFWKKKFQKFQKLGKKKFPHKIPQGPPQAGPLCLGVFPSCHNTFHQIWSNSSFLPFPPLLYRLSEFTLKYTQIFILYYQIFLIHNFFFRYIWALAPYLRTRVGMSNFFLHPL